MTYERGSGMRSAIRLALFAVAATMLPAAGLPYYTVLSEDAGAWPAILSSIGLQRQPAGVSRIFVARTGAPASQEWKGRVEQGDLLILEGESSLAEMFGFRPTREQVKVHEPSRHTPSGAFHCLGKGPGTAGLRVAPGRSGVRERALEWRSADGRTADEGRRGPVGGGASGRAWLRALSVSASRP